MNSEPHADIREMYMAHVTFRREIGLIPALVRRVQPSDTKRARVIADHFALVLGVLHHHHHAEDTHLWPRLLTRGGADTAPVVRAMEGQHGAMDVLIAEATTGMASWQETAELPQGETIADAVERLWRQLVAHLDAEEELALPLIEKYITAAEWGQMVAESAAGIAPEQATLLLGMMMYEGDPAVIRDTIEHMPAEVRPVIADLAAEAFARHAELVHGTPTPAKSSELS